MKERVKNIIKNWILRIDKEETLPKEIIALNFGLFEPYGIEPVSYTHLDVYKRQV